ncbi:MAG: hypothetical protein WCC84_16415 [Candidatus Cybelea sp.]
MTISSIRPGLCLTIAVIAAAVADPIVEFASNAGWLGAGSFTDHSNLDIIPALLLGVGLLALYMVRRAHAVLAGRAIPRRIAGLLPTVFVLQITTLYAMETLEQIAVWGHPFGAAVWLGGPPAISLAIHAAICMTVTYVVVRSGRTLAATTLRVIRLAGAIASLAVQTVAPLAMRPFDSLSFKALLPVPCTIGERAPPFAPR